MSRILLLIDCEKTRSLLAEELARQYQVLIPNKVSGCLEIGSLLPLEKENLSTRSEWRAPIPVWNKSEKESGTREESENFNPVCGEFTFPTSEIFDLCILDKAALLRHLEGLEAQKATSESFLPVLLACDRAFLAVATDKAKQLIDDVLLDAIEPAELKKRVENLLARRHLSLVCPVQATLVAMKKYERAQKNKKSAHTFTEDSFSHSQHSFLKQSEEHFRAFVEAIRDYAIFMLDKAGIVVSWNAGARRIMGYAEEEIIGQHFSCFYPPEDIECGKPEQELQLVATAGQCEDEGVRVRKDGSKFWANVQIAALPPRDGQQVGFSVITHDLSDRKQIEAELCSLNRALRTICDCNQALVRSSDETELLQEICRIIVEVGKYRVAWVGFIEGDDLKSVRLVATAPLENPPEKFDTHVSFLAEKAMREGQPCVANNILESGDRGYTSAIALPLIETGDWSLRASEPRSNISQEFSLAPRARGGSLSNEKALGIGERMLLQSSLQPKERSSISQSFGILTIYAAEPDAFDASQVRLLRELAMDVAYGIQALRTRAQRAKAEAALRESEERYRQLVELSPEAIVVHSQGKIELINTAGAKLLGAASPEQLIGRSVIDFVHPDCQEIVKRGINKIVEEKRIVSFVEQKLVRLDRTEVSVESAATPFTYQGNTAVLVVARDLTDRKRMEKALLHSEELHRLTLSNISDAILIADNSGSLTYICPNVELIFGYSVQEVIVLGNIVWLLGENLFDWTQLETLGEIHNIERKITRKNGQIATLLVSVKRVSINGGTVLYTCRDISDRVRAQSALQQSEELLRKVLETLPVGVWVTDANGKILQANPASQQIWGGVGYVGIERYGTYKGWWADSGQPIGAEEWALHRAIARGETSINEVIDIECCDGTRKTILNSAVPLRNAFSEIAGAIVVNQDITELRQAQQALQESHQQIVNIFESITDAFFAVDLQWRFTYVNRQAEQLLQKKREDLLGQKVWESFPEVVGSIFFEEYNRAISRRVAVSFEGYYPALNSWFEVHAYPSKEGLAVYFKNITQRKQAQEALIESAHQLRAVFEGAMDAMAIADDTGNYVVVNPAAGALFGLPAGELIGRHIAEFITDPEFDFKQAWRIFRQRGRATGECSLRREDGIICQIEYSAVANFLPGRHLAVVRDITERKRTERELRQYRSQLEELVEARTKELTRTNEQLQEEIRQRSRVEAALRAGEEQLRTLINATPDIICFKDGTGRWQEANRAILQLFQLESVDYRGLKDSQLADYSSFYRATFLNSEKTDEMAWRNGTLLSFEEVISQPDGSRKIYDVIKVPLLDAEGTRQGIVVLGRDVTNRVNAEEELNRLASIVESSDDAIVGHTLEGIIVSWNSGAEKIYGYSAGEVKGQSSAILAPEDRRDELPQILERIQQGCRLEHYETIRLRKDGQKIEVALTISPIFDSAGRMTGVSSIARDISDRLRIEAVLERLRHQNELILNSAGEGICGLDVRGKTTFVNPAASRMLGYELRELLGQPMHALLHHSHSDKTPYALEDCPIYASLQDGSVHNVTDEVFWRKDGSYFPVEYLSTPILERGKIVGAVVTFRDITERLAVERMKDEFISIVSHELRTPLTSIRGSMGLLAGGILNSQPQKAQRMLDIAVANTDRLVRLINDILDLERIQSGKVTMERQLCNAADLMVQATDTMRTLAEKAAITLSVAPVSVQLWADPDRLIQTLTNLLSNAIKFSPPGTTVWLTGEIVEQGSEGARGGGNALTRGRSYAGTREQGNNISQEPPCSSAPLSPQPPSSSVPPLSTRHSLLVTVRDQGRGIPADKLETIFERFQQVDSSDSRQKGGTGLGLAICRSIVQQHGGQIWAQSHQGEETKFCFTLPIVERNAIASKPLVLMAAPEQAPEIRSRVQTLLEEQGYRVMPVASPQEAAERSHSSGGAAILLDLSVAGIDSWETLAALKARFETEEIPIILFSDLAAPSGPENEDKPAGKKAQNQTNVPLVSSQTSLSPSHLARSALRILLVEDDSDLAQVLCATFARHGIETIHATTAAQTFELCQNWTPDLLILDLILPVGDGFAVIDWLRGGSRLRQIPVMIYTALDLDKSDREQLKLGQTQFVTKTRMTPTEFEGRVLELLNRIVISKKVDENRGSQAHSSD